MDRSLNKERGYTFFALLLLIGVLFFAIWYMRSPAFEDFIQHRQPLSEEEESEMIKQGSQHLIEITSKGFVPEILRIQQYDTVSFLNTDFEAHQPQALNPEDGQCESFGSPISILQHQSYSFVFIQKGECAFGDALSDFPAGLITIKTLKTES